MLCAGQVFHQLVSFLAVIFLHVIFDVLALLFNPVHLCFFHAFLDFLVDCPVLPYSFRIFLLLQPPSFVRPSKSAVTQGFLTGRCVPRISLAVLVTAVLKVLINVSMSVPSASRMVSAANVPPITAWKTSATSGSFTFSRSNLILVWPSFLTLFRCSLKVIMTSS